MSEVREVKTDIMNMLCDYATGGCVVDRNLIAAVQEDLRLWKECVAYSHEQRVEAAIEGSEWKQRALLAERKLENVPEGWSDLVAERDEAREIAKMLWRDDIAYSASKVLEKAPWLESEVNE